MSETICTLCLPTICREIIKMPNSRYIYDSNAKAKVIDKPIEECEIRKTKISQLDQSASPPNPLS